MVTAAADIWEKMGAYGRLGPYGGLGPSGILRGEIQFFKQVT